MKLRPDYPNSAPQIQFTGPLPFHPNVDQAGGRICFSFFSTKWNKNMNITIDGSKEILFWREVFG